MSVVHHGAGGRLDLPGFGMLASHARFSQSTTWRHTTSAVGAKGRESRFRICQLPLVQLPVSPPLASIRLVPALECCFDVELDVFVQTQGLFVNPAHRRPHHKSEVDMRFRSPPDKRRLSLVAQSPREAERSASAFPLLSSLGLPHSRDFALKSPVMTVGCGKLLTLASSALRKSSKSDMVTLGEQ